MIHEKNIKNPHFAVMDTFEDPQIIEFCLFVNANIVCCKMSIRLQRVAILFESADTPREEMTKLRSL